MAHWRPWHADASSPVIARTLARLLAFVADLPLMFTSLAPFVADLPLVLIPLAFVADLPLVFIPLALVADLSLVFTSLAPFVADLPLVVMERACGGWAATVSVDVRLLSASWGNLSVCSVVVVCGLLWITLV